MSKTCEDCMGKPGFHACAICEANPAIKKQTNADRIRAMTDEELAEALLSDRSCPNCPPIDVSVYAPCEDVENCTTCWLEWLKKEVEDEQG